jgi:transposase-like protein
VATTTAGLSVGRPPAGATVVLKDEAARMERDGLSRVRISRELGVSETTLRKWLGRSAAADLYGPKPDKLRAAKAMIDAGTPYARIVRSLGINHSTLAAHFGPSPYVSSSLEFAQAERSRVAQERYEEMVRLRMQEGKTNREISDAIGISMERIHQLMGRTPERLGGYRLTTEGEILRARRMRVEEELTIEEVARRLGRSRSTVGGWLKGVELEEVLRSCRWCERDFLQPAHHKPSTFCLSPDSRRRSPCRNAYIHWTNLHNTRGPARAAEYRERKLAGQQDVESQPGFD